MGSVSTELRQAVLQSAIQGKLTEQLVADGYVNLSLLKTKNHSKIVDELDIPDNWINVHLEDVTKIISTKQYQILDSQIQKTGMYPVISQSKQYLIGYSDLEDKVLKSNNKLIAFGDHTTVVKIIDFAFIVGADGVKLFETTEDIIPDYLYYCMSFNASKIADKGGYSRHYKFIKNVAIPLPPLAEQKRIVARVNELMTKIDELEKVESELRALHQAFPNDMKSALLQAAMQGKLTKQLPEDGNAKTLLIEAINSRKAIGKLPKTNSVDNIDFPDNWGYASVGNIFGLLKGNNISGKQLPYLEAKYLRGNIEANIKDSGEFVSKGTRVILVDGENSGEIFIEPEDGYLGSTFKILYIPECLNVKFACYFIEMNRMLLRSKKKGVAIPHLNKEIFYNLVFPVPPLAEQKRIVEKLDKLLPLCDSLKVDL